MFEADSNPPFSKREVSLQDSTPSLEKRGRGDFSAERGANYVAIFWVKTLAQSEISKNEENHDYDSDNIEYVPRHKMYSLRFSRAQALTVAIRAAASCVSIAFPCGFALRALLQSPF
jgi:hypothetical protein